MQHQLLKVANTKPGAIEINDFTWLFGRIVDQWNKLLPATERDEMSILYAPTFPDHVFNPTGTEEANRNLPHNVVTYEVTRRDNGTMDAKAFSGTREVRPRAREEKYIIDSNGVQQMRTIFGKWYDNTVRFECYAPTAFQADRLIHTFEGIYEIHAPWLESIGVIKTIYDGRTTPSYNYKTNYHVRSFQVYVKTERLWYLDDSIIDQIHIEVGEEYKVYTDSIVHPAV